MRFFTFIFLGLMSCSVFAQSAGQLVRRGNYKYLKENFGDAAIKYREASDVDGELYQAKYNLGNAYYKQEQYDEAVDAYTEAISGSKENDQLSQYYFNLGNAYFKKQDLNSAVQAYKNALRKNYANDDARHNLYLAQQLLKQQEQQQQQDKNDNPEEPSEYAKMLRKQAGELIDQRKYRQAYDLMKEGENADPTVAYYHDFTTKAGEVADINGD